VCLRRAQNPTDRMSRVSAITHGCWRQLLLILLMNSIIRFDASRSPITFVGAYPNGAGSCVGGMASIGGFHLESTNSQTGDKRTVLTGELSEGKVSVLIDDTDALDFAAPYGLQTQTDYTITVVTTQDPGYKGILLRFANADNAIDAATQILLEPVDDLLQPSEHCSTDEVNTVGLTHTDNVVKLSVRATMRFDAPGTVQLGITIVGANDAEVSVYGYTGFVLEVTGDPYVSTPAPTTAAPVTLPPGVTRAPSTAPTLSDVISQTLSPTYDRLAVQNAENVTKPTSSTPTSSSASSQPNMVMGVLFGMFVLSWSLFVDS
jgi:hypothetical protein